MIGLALVAAAARGGVRSDAAGGEAAGFEEELALANEQYERRDEGAEGPLARPGPVDEAIAGYRRALLLRPDSAEARYRLLRALFFRATFCGTAPEERKRIFEEARDLADEGVERLERAIGDRPFKKGTAALRTVDGAGELLYWTAVTWGQWTLDRSRLAAARAGAPGRIRDLSQAVIEVDPDLEEGGGYRVLGRLHDQCPTIPFVTGWVSRRVSLASLRKAYAAFPENSVNHFFLADALLRHEPSRREEARTLLARLASSEPRAQFRVEDAHFAAKARDLLARVN